MTNKVRFFDTERQAEKFVKSKKSQKLQGFERTVQGNTVVLIKRTTPLPIKRIFPKRKL